MRLALAGLVLTTALVYRGVGSHRYVYEDGSLLSTVPPITWTTILPSRILGSFSVWLISHVFSDRVQHQVNLWLHLVNGLLVYGVVASLGATSDPLKRRPLGPTDAPSVRWDVFTPAWLSAAMFLLHPIQGQAVNYVTSRTDVLGTMFVLLAILALARGWLVAYVLGAMLAMMTKEIMIVVVPVGLLVSGDWRGWRRGAWVVIGAGLLAVNMSAWAGVTWRYVWAGTVSLQLLSLWRMIGFVVVPWGFSIEHDYTGVPRAVGVAALAGLALVAVWAWRARQTHRLVVYGLAWTLIWVLPRLVLRLPEPINEGQFYGAFAGICIAIGAVVAKWVHFDDLSWLKQD